MLNTIFCSVGRRVELLRTFKAAYADLKLAGEVIALDVDPLAPAIRIADRFHFVPRLSHPDFVSSFLSICEKEAPAIVFPLIDPDIPAIAPLRAELEKRGSKFAGIQERSVEVTEDKWIAKTFFEGLGLKTPASWLPPALPAQMQFPAFIKPRRGSAGQDAFKVTTQALLGMYVQIVPDPIVQEFIGSPEVTTDVVCDLTGAVLAVVSRQRIEVRGGEVSKAVTIRDPRIEAGCIKIAQALDARGPITVQCFLTDQGPVFSEINARLGGGFPLGVAAGANSPKWLLAKAAGVPIEIPPIGSYQTGLYMTRYDQSFVVDGDGLKNVQRHSL